MTRKPLPLHKDQPCAECGKVDDLLPYGTDGVLICYTCMRANPAYTLNGITDVVRTTPVVVRTTSVLIGNSATEDMILIDVRRTAADANVVIPSDWTLPPALPPITPAADIHGVPHIPLVTTLAAEA